MKAFLCFIFITFYTLSYAQAPYNKAIGVKFPGGFSVTYKKFVADTKNLEFQATIWNKGFRVSGLYEFNFYSFPQIPTLSWFVGPGAHIGFWKDQYGKSYGSNVDIGIDGIIGLDYKMPDLPLNFSLDWQPAITLIGDASFAPASGGIAARFTF
ncbi:MAG: hypothetical protein JSS67_03175 [Bacteroidetes bacterium]|nr:hypothetical protein [Bacteroidota bacterium]